MSTKSVEVIYEAICKASFGGFSAFNVGEGSPSTAGSSPRGSETPRPP